MPPITKIWTVTLREGRSMVQTAFSGAWIEGVMNTEPNATPGDKYYGLYQCDEEPEFLLAIVGYPSVEAGDLAQKATAEMTPRFLDLVTHRDLLVLEIDAKELPLDSDRIAILFSKSQPADAESLPGRGDWAVPTRSFLNEPHTDDATISRKTWIHVASSEDGDGLSQAGAIKRFTRVIQSRFASQATA